MGIIKLSIDAGFDSAKIIVNEFEVYVPFNICNITKHETQFLSNYRDDYIEIVDDNMHYIVGEQARTLLYNSQAMEKSIRDLHDPAKRFLCDEFRIVCVASMAYAFYKASEAGVFALDDVKDAEIYAIFNLPHSQYADLKQTMQSTFEGIHSANMVFSNSGSAENVSLEFTIKRVAVSSQAIDAVIAHAGTVEEKTGEDILDDAPILVVDGGQRTVGLARIEKGGALLSDKADSFTNFAMLEVNQQTAKDIEKATGREFTDYMVEAACTGRTPEVIKYIDKESGKVKEYNVKEAREKNIEKYCELLFEEVDKPIYGLLDIRNIVVAGGTGSCYYPYLVKRYVNDMEVLDKSHVIMVEPTLNGKKYDAIFAVAVGGYKTLEYMLSSVS